VLKRHAAVIGVAVLLMTGCGHASQASGSALVPQGLTIGVDRISDAYVSGCRTRQVGAVVQGRSVNLPTFEVWLSSGHGSNAKTVYFALQPFAGAASYTIGAAAGTPSANLRLTIPAVETSETSTRSNFVGRSGYVTIKSDQASGSMSVDADGTRIDGMWRCR
jgi:hypothetical protein